MKRFKTVFLSMLVIILCSCLVVAQDVSKKQAPMLQKKVENGELPPLNERIPENPLVIPVVDRIGEYGGTLYGVGVGGRGIRDTRQMIGMEQLLHFGKKGVEANIVEFELSDDAKTLTLYLRKGMKWSDGAPFTADDILFWYEDILQNKELTPVISDDWKPGGELFKMEKIDEYTLKWKFAAPHPHIDQLLAHIYGVQVYAPKHYLKNYHPKYTSMDKLKKLVAEQKGVNYWYDIFNSKRENYLGIPMQEDLPTIEAYMVKERRPDGMTFIRNPYFWKVDPEGNQLPYIDEVEVTGVSNSAAFNAKILSGEVDLTTGFQTSISNIPLYKMGEEDGNYKVLLWETSDSADIFFTVNKTSKDPTLRKLFQDKRFRQALSLSINREEINNVVFLGMGKPVQLTVRPEAVYYEPEFVNAYIEYKPEKANKLLDEMGLKWDSEHKYRVDSDGKPIGWTIEFLARASWVETMEMCIDYWQDIGFDVKMKQREQAIYRERVEANEIDMTVWHADENTEHGFNRIQALYVPHTQIWHSSMAPAWVDWYEAKNSNKEIPENAMEPPQEIKELLKLSEIVRTSPDKEERIKAGKEILSYQAENLMSIGIIKIPKPVIKNNNLHNVPESNVLGWCYMGPAFIDPHQYFFSSPRNQE